MEQKVKNISSLIDFQLDLKALADMTDLETTINALNENAPDDIEREEEIQEIVHNEKERTNATQDCNKTNSDWPPKEGDFILGPFEDGVYPGSVNHDGEYANCDFMG